MTAPTTNAALVATTPETFHRQLVAEALNTLADALSTARNLTDRHTALAYATQRLNDLGEM